MARQTFGFSWPDTKPIWWVSVWRVLEKLSVRPLSKNLEKNVIMPLGGLVGYFFGPIGRNCMIGEILCQTTRASKLTCVKICFSFSTKYSVHLEFSSKSNSSPKDSSNSMPIGKPIKGGTEALAVGDSRASRPSPHALPNLPAERPFWLMAKRPTRPETEMPTRPVVEFPS